MLRGRRLSEVQEVGLQMLMIMEQRRDAQRFVEDLRARIAASNPSRMRDLFPEWFPARPAADAPADIDQIDDSQVEWAVPSSESARAELDRWIAEHSAGTVSGGALGGDWQ